MIFHTGDVLCNCIKIQYYTSAFCYFFMYYNHQQDTQDADKLVLPALGGDRGGAVTKSVTLSYPSPVSPKEGEAVCLLMEKADRQCLAILQQDISRTLKKRTNQSSPL